MTNTGNRKFGLAALVGGGAVSAGEWEVAVAVFVVYTIANLLSPLLRRGETASSED